MSLSAVSAAISASTASTTALASSLQSAELVVGLLEQGQQNLEALASQIEPPAPPPTLDGTGTTVNRSV